MSKKIRLSLSTNSIKNAIAEIEEFKQELKFKVSVFVQRLAAEGLTVVNANKQNFQGDSDGSDLDAFVRMTYTDNSATATLVLSGKDVAFIEFGAGVHYNTPAGTSPNPLGQELGMTIGSYGQGKGANDSWVYYDEDRGKYKTSYGTKAAMPLYKADEAIRNKFLDIAKEVFE